MKDIQNWIGNYRDLIETNNFDVLFKKVWEEHGYEGRNEMRSLLEKADVEFLEHMIYIPRGFYADSRIVAIDIPENIVLISKAAFSGCFDLKKVTLHEGLQEIKNDAFESCISLKSITIPKSVSILEESAFYKCESLENVKILNGNIRAYDIQDIFYESQNVIVECPKNSHLAKQCEEEGMPYKTF